MKIPEIWFNVLSGYICTGMFSQAYAHVKSVFLSNEEYDKILEIPVFPDEKEWELYYSYLKEKLTK